MLRMFFIYFHSWKSQNREEFELHFASRGLGNFNKRSSFLWSIFFGPIYTTYTFWLDLPAFRQWGVGYSRNTNWNMGSLVHFQCYLYLNNGLDQYGFTEVIAVASLHKYINISVFKNYKVSKLRKVTWKASHSKSGKYNLIYT